jgi:hypothetical protein
MERQYPLISAQPEVGSTDHAMLVVWGEYAQEIGLVQALEAVPIPQRTRRHCPQTKLLELMVATLAGCAYLQDLNEGPHPIAKDKAVARAWGQPAWAHYSTVSRTLQVCSAETVRHVQMALDQVGQPFIDREVLLAVRDSGILLWDGDLTGRPVSPTSQTYPDAAFGWMGDEVGLGYQAALISQRSPTYGRLLLAGFRHPGDTVSVECLHELIEAAEARTGVRPRRRVELVAERLIEQSRVCQAHEAKLTIRQTEIQQARASLIRVIVEQYQVHRDLVALEAQYHEQGRPERKYSRLAKLRHRLGVLTRRRQRRVRDFRQALERLARQKQHLAVERSQLAALQSYHERLVAENEANPAPVRIIIRLDQGFCSGPNLADLIELGYEIYSKPYHAAVTAGLRQRVTPETCWERVGANAEMTAWASVQVSHCPYPVTAALERFRIDGKLHYSSLVYHGPEPVHQDLPGWFGTYNGRQTIEAGIKEGKGVFQIKHMKMRSMAGMDIQELFTLFAANFVRWAAVWLAGSQPKPPKPFDQPQASVKRLVRVAANTSAWVIYQPQGTLLMFTKSSPFAGAELLVRGGWCFQPPLPLLKSVEKPP